MKGCIPFKCQEKKHPAEHKNRQLNKQNKAMLKVFSAVLAWNQAGKNGFPDLICQEKSLKHKVVFTYNFPLVSLLVI